MSLSPSSASPSATLLAAADLIRDLAAAATEGPWSFDDSTVDEDGEVYAANGEPVAIARAGGDWINSAKRDGNGRWIAALSPALAPHLEAIFRAMVAAARQAEAIPRESARIYPKGFHAVLDLARAVLGSGVNTHG